LGGDLLRPYLLINYSEATILVSKDNFLSLSQPRVIQKLIKHSNINEAIINRKTITDNSNSYVLWEFNLEKVEPRIFNLPNVYITTLTNVSHYRTRRYPLNVARLAQWLRFQNAARVKVVDFALDFDGKIELLVKDISKFSPDILGISLNFGELKSFHKLISSIKKAGLQPFICLGNILAAWAHDEVIEVCSDFQLNISQSYGEYDLEQVCQLFSCGMLSKYNSAIKINLFNQSNSAPSIIVVPDERLLVETLRQKGQASIETSFGCQYGLCTFCPRDHRGKGWYRPAIPDSTNVIRNISSLINEFVKPNSGILSIIDEDAFGQEGRVPSLTPSILNLIKAAAEVNVKCEIYTRVEQIFDPCWEKSHAIQRLYELKQISNSLSRVFVGVESGCNSQLHRFGKGQTIESIVKALRAGSIIGLPLEFGFITFDPLLTQDELTQNLIFLGRKDILLPFNYTLSPQEVYEIAIKETDNIQFYGEPVFLRVAYMATELELFVNSPFLRLLRNFAPDLVGTYNTNFARYNYTYLNANISHIANICRVWTEGVFEPIYRMRIAVRSVGVNQKVYGNVINRYKKATYGLLLTLAYNLCQNTRIYLTELWNEYCSELPLSKNSIIGISQLKELWNWVISDNTGVKITERVKFQLNNMERRREA